MTQNVTQAADGASSSADASGAVAAGLGSVAAALRRAPAVAPGIVGATASRSDRVDEHRALGVLSS